MATITGTPGGDTIRPVEAGGSLGGLANATASGDLINGLAGADLINGGAGNDILNGGDDFDIYEFAPGFGADSINDSVNGGVIRLLAGIVAADLRLVRSSDNLRILVGTDQITIVNQYTGTGVDALPAPVITGIELDDGTLIDLGAGLPFNGTPAAESVIGSGLDDTLAGLGGNDSLFGGAGFDTYLFGQGFGTDFINDSAHGGAIRFQSGILPADLRLVRVTDNLRLFVGGDQITIANQYSAIGTDALPVPVITDVIFDDGTVIDLDAGLTFTGTAAGESIGGSGLDDTLEGLGGNDVLLGGGGFDAARYHGAEADYSVTQNSNGSTTVSGPEGTDTLLNIELLIFSDGERELDSVPRTGGEAYFLDQDTLLVVPADGVLANDTDSAGDPLTAVLVDGPDHGSLALLPDGSFTYEPNAGFAGDDRFFYQASDGTFLSRPTRVSLFILPAATAPIADDDAYATGQDGVLAVAAPGVLAGDVDANFDPLTARLVDDVANGLLLLSADGSFVYTPAPGFSGTDRFTYVASDGALDSNIATVTITVESANDPPFVVADAFAVARGRVSAIEAAAGLGANDSDPDGDALIFSLITDTPQGSVVVSPDGGFTYTAVPNFLGDTQFTYRAADPGGQFTDALAVLTVEERAETIEDNSGLGVLFGYGLDDRLFGLDGNDLLDGGDGDDKLFGGLGNDTMNGGEGNDRIFDPEGDNILNGDAGNDILYAGSGADTLNGGDGNDTLSGAGGDDVVNGGDGRDKLYGNDGNDTLDGGADNDTVQGGAGDDTILGGDGNDFLFGQNGDDVVDGGGGNDHIWGEAGNDDLAGGAGDDIVRGGDGVNRIDGAAGTDVLFGGADQDIFVLARSFANRDWINGFVSGTDRLEVDGALFGLAPGALDPSRLVANANPVANAAGEFLFDTDSGVLRWDADGAGGAGPQIIATLTGITTLNSTDFIIV